MLLVLTYQHEDDSHCPLYARGQVFVKKLYNALFPSRVFLYYQLLETEKLPKLYIEYRMKNSIHSTPSSFSNRR